MVFLLICINEGGGSSGFHSGTCVQEAAKVLGWVSKGLGAVHGGAHLCNCSSSNQEADRRVKSSRPAWAVHKTLYSQKERKLREPI